MEAGRAISGVVAERTRLDGRGTGTAAAQGVAVVPRGAEEAGLDVNLDVGGSACGDGAKGEGLAVRTEHAVLKLKGRTDHQEVLGVVALVEKPDPLFFASEDVGGSVRGVAGSVDFICGAVAEADGGRTYGSSS